MSTNDFPESPYPPGKISEALVRHLWKTHSVALPDIDDPSVADFRRGVRSILRYVTHLYIQQNGLDVEPDTIGHKILGEN